MALGTFSMYVDEFPTMVAANLWLKRHPGIVYDLIKMVDGTALLQWTVNIRSMEDMSPDNPDRKAEVVV